MSYNIKNLVFLTEKVGIQLDLFKINGCLGNREHPLSLILYTLSFDNLLVSPSSVLERRIRSSAHNIQLSCFPSPILGDS